MDFTIPDDLRQLQRLARQFITRELLPLEREVEERDEFPEEVRWEKRRKAIELGLWNYGAPEEYGGGGVGMLGCALVHEELGRVSVAVGLQGGVVGASCSGISPFGELLAFASEGQRDRYVVPHIRGEIDAAIALTEPGAGSDAGAIQTTATRDGDDYVLNGRKTFITCARRSHFTLVFAVTDPARRARGGISCFVVERDTPGFVVERHIPMMGRRGLPSYEVALEDCRVGPEQLFGVEGQGLEVGQALLTRIRLGVSAWCAGTAQRALDMGAAYARDRVTFGKPLVERQFVQGMLADAYLDILATRTMTHHLAWRADAGEEPTAEIGLLKAHATEMACRVVDDMIQVHGGVGYTRDLPLEMLYRDLRLYRIGDGPTEVLKSWAARRLFGGAKG